MYHGGMEGLVGLSTMGVNNLLKVITRERCWHKLFMADVRLSKTSWNGEITVPKVAVGPPDDTSSSVGRTQLTTTFFRQQLTVKCGQVSRS